MRFKTIFWSFGSGLLFWATLYHCGPQLCARALST